MKIGPRRVYLYDPATGEEEQIHLFVETEYTHGKIYDDDPLNITGHVDLVGPDWNMRLKVYATDEIQAVGRLVKLAGAALLGSCDRDGRQLRTPDRDEPLADPMLIF